MTMKLPWRYVDLLPDHSARFNTSITANESMMLRHLARGRSVVEVGTAYGYSACLMAQTARFVLTVDPHHGYGSMSGSLSFAINSVRELDMEDRVQLAIAKSTSFLPRLAEAGARFDMAFIDGDHRYDAVKADLANAWQLLRPGGILAVHDYGEETCPDVYRAVVGTFGGADLVDTLWVVKNEWRMRADLVDTLWTVKKP